MLLLLRCQPLPSVAVRAKSAVGTKTMPFGRGMAFGALCEYVSDANRRIGSGILLIRYAPL